MWVLDVLDAGGVARSLHLVAGEWSVGRKQCHFNFHGDASISREHAVIRVGALTAAQLGDPSSRPALVLEDRQSRFGSYVNAQPCLPTRELKHGDEVSFGAKRTVLHVRYLPFVLVASRLGRASRARVSEACQQTGMHLVAAESRAATHCIVDQGKVVATAKVLWALVYNQPVVCAPWLFAILERKSMSEPLPRCEDYLPVEDASPELAAIYLPNPKRTTLYQRHAVVFLAPQPMEALIAAMGGQVVAAYATPDDDDALLKEVERKAAGRVVLVVDATGGSGMSTTTAGQTDSKDQELSQAAAIERRISLFQSLGTAFTNVHELAGSVLFSKTPAVAADVPFSNSLATHAGSSIQTGNYSPEPLGRRHSVLSVGLDGGTQSLAAAVKEERPREAKMPRDQAAPVPREQEAEANSEGTNNIMEMLTSTHSSHASLAAKPEPSTTPPLDEGASCNGEEGYKPAIELCDVVVGQREPEPRALSAPHGSFVNFKRFRKGNGYRSASRASLFPRPTVVSVTVNNAEREAEEASLAMLEEQERIADELFAMAEGRKQRKLF